jgi:hypothetical protein
MQLHGELLSATMPPKEYYFEQEMVRRLRNQSYQDPTKISDGLALIWDENHKWQKIGTQIGMTEEDTRVKLRLIVTRRNAIVHEADIDPVSHRQNTITGAECGDMADFLERCGEAITNLVL